MMAKGVTWAFFGLILAATYLLVFNNSSGRFHEVRHDVVQRVIDGHTLLLMSGKRVRLIGVDTLATKHPNRSVEYFAKEAAAFTKRLAERKRIKLEYDQANAQKEHRDQSGRTLAYVFLHDGTLINSEIIRQGYGYAFTRYPSSRINEFRRLESEAREQRRGLWQNSP
jgi:micrococcal nuclease